MEKAIGRRGVLALLGSAPFVAKEAAATPTPEAAADVVSVGREGRRAVGTYAQGRSKVRKKLYNLLKDGQSIPAYKTKEWMEDAKEKARILDPDLATMKSLSLASKVRVQTDRNFQRNVEGFLSGYSMDDAWEAFKKALNAQEDWDED